MYKISLINMPFASLHLPSLALTQLKSISEKQFGDRVRVRVLYLSQEFAHFLGLDLYNAMTNSFVANNSGLGDWFFRQAAFPDHPDNAAEYFRRYFPKLNPELTAKRKVVEQRRGILSRFIQRLVVKHRLADEDLVGCSSMFAQNAASMAMAREVKARNPKVVTVVGGANCEAPMGCELALHVDAFDFVFSGPALVSFPQLIQHQMDGEPEKCHEVRGVFSARNVERLKDRAWMGQELPIEVEVPLDYEPFLTDLNRNFPNGMIKPSLTFETSRGCWWGERSHCTFCGLNGTTMAYRGMPSEMATALFNDMFEKYGDRCKRFESVDNILPRRYLTEVFPELETPEDVSIFYEVKADLKEHEMGVLAKAGVRELQPGIESLNSSTLKLMGKGTTAYGNIAFLKYCIKHGVTPVWNLLIGFPREKETVYEKYLADMPLLRHLPPPSGAFPVRFDRFSPYFVNTEEYGLKLKPYDFYSFIYPFPEEAITNMAYYFEDVNYGADYIRTTVAWADKLTAGVQEWHKAFHRLDPENLPAKLYFVARDDSYIVHDTRSGSLVEHEVSDLGLEILNFVSTKGRKVAHMVRGLNAEAARLEDEVGRLRELGLLFEENGRYLSVVMDSGDDDFKAAEIALDSMATRTDSLQTTA